MDYRLMLFFVAAAALAVNALEYDDGVDNPIIEFFEAPVRAFKTKAVEHVEPRISNYSPEGKSVGLAKAQSNSWFRGKGLADWLMSRTAVTTTTAAPEAVLNTPVAQQQNQMPLENMPNRRRMVKRNNVRRVGVAQNQNGGNRNRNWRRNANANRRRYNRRPIEDDVSYSEEEGDYSDFYGPRRYQMAYDTVPYHSASYDDSDDEVSLEYSPLVKHHQMRRGDQKKITKPNSSYLQPFHDIPIQARPIRLRQNLPATKPIGNKQQGNKPGAGTQANGNRNPANNNANNKNKKKKNKKPTPVMNVQPQRDPVHFIVQPQANGQLPVLIPVNNKPQGNKRPNHVLSDQPAHDDYNNYQYVPIPVSAFGPGGYKGIPQIQVIAQHTHTFRPHHGYTHGSAGYPTEVIFGPAGFDNAYPGQQDEAMPPKRRPVKNKNEANQMNHQTQRIVLASDDSMKNEGAVTAIMEEHMIDPTKQTIIMEELKPETTLATQTATGEDMMDATMDADEKEIAEVRSADGRQHIVVPRHLLPVFAASSLVEVANNGRFLIKTGRDLKVADHEPGHIDATVTEVIDLPQKDEVKSESDHSVIKKDEVEVEEKPQSAAADSAVLPSSDEAKPAEAEKALSEKIPILPEQLQDIPVTIVQDEPVEQPAKSEKTGRSVSDHNARKPLLRSEVVNEKRNGHFIVKSGVAPADESRSNREHHTAEKEASSEITNIKVKPIENSRAL